MATKTEILVKFAENNAHVFFTPNAHIDFVRAMNESGEKVGRVKFDEMDRDFFAGKVVEGKAFAKLPSDSELFAIIANMK